MSQHVGGTGRDVEGARAPQHQLTRPVFINVKQQSAERYRIRGILESQQEQTALNLSGADFVAALQKMQRRLGGGSENRSRLAAVPYLPSSSNRRNSARKLDVVSSLSASAVSLRALRRLFSSELALAMLQRRRGAVRRK